MTEQTKKQKRANHTGYFRKLEDGRVRWEFRKGGKTRASGTNRNLTEAKAAYAKAQTDFERGRLLSTERATFNEYSQAWLESLPKLSQNTLDKYTREIKLAQKELGGLLMRELKPTHVKRALSKLSEKEANSGLGRGRTLSSSTLAGVRTRIRAVVRSAVDDEIMLRDVTANVKRVKPLKTEHPGIALDFEQAARLHELGEILFDAGQCRLWPALFLCLSVGLRKGEATGLQWQDINFVTGVLTIQRNLTTSSKGVYLRDGAKTKASNREIYLPASAIAILKHQHEKIKQEAKALGITLKHTSPIFPNELGNYSHPDSMGRALACILEWSNPELANTKPGKKKIFHISNLEHRLRNLDIQHRPRLKAAVLAGEALPKISPHDLRHTAGSLALMRGVSIEAVSDMLGHKDSSVTRQTYIHITDKFRRENVIDLFPSLPERDVQPVVMQ